MSARKREPEPGDWTYSVGEPPALLTAHERADRGNAIYSRVWTGQQYVEKRVLCEPIRGEDGRIVPELEIRAQRAAIDRQKAYAAGAEEVFTGPLTLELGFRKLLDAKEGKYASDSRWKQDVGKNSQTIMDVLGRSTLWATLRHAHYRRLWRALAEENRKSGRYGARQAEVIVGLLQSAVNWLHEEMMLERGVGLPARQWKQILRSEWAEITKKPLAAPAKPRNTVEEQRALWRALPEADPRLALAVELGAELRLGQVARTQRSDVLPHGGEQLGAVQVHGRGKKKGVLIVLTDSQRAVLGAAVQDGYLAGLEAAYAAGTVADYFLITGGYLSKGRAQVKHAGESWERSAMRKAWRELERLAGVTHMAGRNWYGLRRLHADLAEDVSGDARTLNAMGGWTHTATRESYQEQGRTDIAERAKDVRAKIRPGGEDAG